MQLKTQHKIKNTTPTFTNFSSIAESPLPDIFVLTVLFELVIVF